MKVKSESEVAQSCLTLATPWTAAFQAPPPMGFSRQEYWSGVPLVNVNPWKRGQTWGTGLTGAQQSDEELASNLSVTRSLKTWSDWLTDHPNLGLPDFSVRKTSSEQVTPHRPGDLSSDKTPLLKQLQGLVF